MRTARYDAVSEAGADELLSTGEVALLLSSSRQHVVDLCDRGELPYATIGTHRRVRRGDMEALQARTQRLTRDQRRSLWLAYATAGRIVEDPDHARALARRNLERMRSASRGRARRWIEEWERLLDGRVDRLLATLVSASPKSRELRQNSPFAGLLDEPERMRVLHAWQAEEGRLSE